MIAGVDVGGTSIRVRTYPGDERVEVDTRATGGEALAARIAGLIADLPRTPDSVGVGVPGLVDIETGTVRHAVNLGIDGRPFPLAGAVAGHLGLPVAVENDVRAAAVGAHHHLGDISNLVYLNCGTGVSAGVILDGELYRGSHAVAGEIGHAPLGDPSIRCSCGLTGCLEAVAGGRSDVAEAPGVASALARAIYVLATVFDPELFVLGGGIGRQAAPAVRQALAETRAASPFAETILSPDRVTVLPPDADAGTRGAAILGSRRLSAPTDAISAPAEDTQGGTRP